MQSDEICYISMVVNIKRSLCNGALTGGHFSSKLTRVIPH